MLRMTRWPLVFCIFLLPAVSRAELRFNRDVRPILDTNWPLQPDARGLIFIYNDPAPPASASTPSGIFREVRSLLWTAVIHHRFHQRISMRPNGIGGRTKQGGCHQPPRV